MYSTFSLGIFSKNAMFDQDYDELPSHPIEHGCQTHHVMLPSHDISQRFSHSWSRVGMACA